MSELNVLHTVSNHPGVDLEDTLRQFSDEIEKQGGFSESGVKGIMLVTDTGNYCTFGITRSNSEWIGLLHIIQDQLARLGD